MDREKVVGHLQILRTWCATNLDFDMGLDTNECRKAVEWLDDVLALLKEQEPVEARLNLCESCTKELAECEAGKDDLVFGSGVGNDNIIGCLRYVNRWKAQEAVDAVPVVRCKDCKHWWKVNELCTHQRYVHGTVCAHDCKATDYCSDGERRDEDAID